MERRKPEEAELSDHPAEYERFEYDAMDGIKRWVQASSSGTELTSGWKVDFTINDLGNLTKRQAIPAGGGTGQTIDYFYAGTNGAGPHAVTSSSFYGPYGYDGNGHQTGRPGNATVTFRPEDLPRRYPASSRVRHLRLRRGRSARLKTDRRPAIRRSTSAISTKSARYSASTALTTFTSFTVRRAPWRR